MRMLRTLASLILSVGTFSCSDPRILGGSGTEAGSGVFVCAHCDPTGAPSFRLRAVGETGAAAGSAQVEIRPLGSTTTEPLFRMRTSSEGMLSAWIPPGEWTLLVRHQGRAFRRDLRSSPDQSLGLIDTLKAVARLVGIFSGCQGNSLSAMGVGVEARCDAQGYFHLDSLPAGRIGLVAMGALQSNLTQVKIEPGIHSMVLAPWTRIPAELTSLASDSLVAWGDGPLPARLREDALADSGAFTLAIRLRRESTQLPLMAISWGDGLANGIQLGWRGPDTLVAKVQGRTFLTAGIPLDTGVQQVGVSWDGRRLAVLRGIDSILTLNTSTFRDRSRWNAPEFASEGVRRLEWIAFRRGELVFDWLGRLQRM